MRAILVGSDGQSHKTVSTNHNLFEEKREPKRYRTEVLPLTNLTPYRYAKPAHSVDVKHYERRSTAETQEDNVWLAMRRENKQDYLQNGHTRNLLTLWNSSVNSQLRNYTGILHILQGVQLWNAATTALQFHHIMFVLLSKSDVGDAIYVILGPYIYRAVLI